MRTLVVSDVHNRVEYVKELLEEAKPYDKVVFLGDYFDSHNDCALEAGITAYWLRNALKDDKNVFLWGNHDLPYGYPNNLSCRCPGWYPWKNDAANAILTRDDWNKLKLFHNEQGIWCSHAGVNYHTFVDERTGLVTEEFVRNVLAAAWKRIERDEEAFEINDWSQAILWCRQTSVIKGVKQVFGHTTNSEPIVKRRGDGGYNCWLDTQNNHYGLIEDGVFSYVNRKTGKKKLVG